MSETTANCSATIKDLTLCDSLGFVRPWFCFLTSYFPVHWCVPAVMMAVIQPKNSLSLSWALKQGEHMQLGLHARNALCV